MDYLIQFPKNTSVEIVMRNVFLNVIRNSIRVLQFLVKKLGNRSAKKSAHSFERSAKRVHSLLD